MSAKKTVSEETKKPANRRPAPVKYATADDIKNITDTIASMADAMGKMMDRMNAPAPKVLTPDEVKHETEIKKAAPDIAVVNPAWVEKANEILGDALDHCEVFYPKHGGTLFTCVIKKEFSNANADYLERYKSDRRTKEIGNEGIEGVEQYCKLIAQNLKRGKVV